MVFFSLLCFFVCVCLKCLFIRYVGAICAITFCGMFMSILVYYVAFSPNIMTNETTKKVVRNHVKFE